MATTMITRAAHVQCATEQCMYVALTRRTVLFGMKEMNGEEVQGMDATFAVEPGMDLIYKRLHSDLQMRARSFTKQESSYK